VTERVPHHDVGDGTPQLAHQPGQRQRAPGPSLDLLHGYAELGEEPRGLLAVVLGRGDRGDDEPRAGAGAGDVEQAALLLEQLARRQRRYQLAPADLVGLEHRGAPPEVGPGVLLDVCHDDEVPLEALRPVGGEQAHRGAAHALLGEGVGGDLLCHQSGQEVAHAGRAGHGRGVALLGLARRDLEQRHDRVEVAVGAPGGAAAELDRAAESPRPVGARPEPPQGVLGRGVGGESVGRRAQQRVHGAGRRHLGTLEVVEEPVAKHGTPDQLARGERQAPLCSRLVLLSRAQEPREPAYVARVEAAERTQEQ
jgi:hypothetical protein